MIRPLVSCIVPVYNGELYLAEAIESVRAQTYPRLEIIIVDDGSADGTAGIARRYAPHATYLHQQNQGPAAARNLGLGAARGEFVSFLDADDLWHPGKIERQLSCFEAHAGLEVCLTKFQNFWVEELAREARKLKDHPLARPMTGFAPPTLLARRSVFEKVGLFDPTRRHGENMDWFLRAADLNVAIHLLPEPLVRRRIHPGNMTRTEGSASRDAFLRFVKDVLDRRRRGEGGESSGYRFDAIVGGTERKDLAS